ncbi:hypothetical protein [Nostoc sp. CCY 9925]|uniref:hypothetical protein n=1 Tax=Nostoc sp. CCY 9925 TaxID=3103865 RepID=UPI0039C6FB02
MANNIQQDGQRNNILLTNITKFGGNTGQIMRNKAFWTILVLPLSGALLLSIGLFPIFHVNCRYSLELKINLQEILIKVEEDNSQCKTGWEQVPAHKLQKSQF